MLKKVVLGVAITTFAFAGAGLNSAFAANGQTEQGNGRSICYFSGLNDNPNDEFPEDGLVQSFGQIVKKVGPLGGIPGLECNPIKGPYDMHA